MKRKLALLVMALCAIFVTSCGHLAQMQDPQKYSASISGDGVKPLHIGKVTPLRHGVYHTQVYDRSVVFMATTGLVRPTQVEVFDLDHDNTFDVVYLNQGGVWSVGFTKSFTATYHSIESTLSSRQVNEWVVRATSVKQSTKQAARPIAITQTNQTQPSPPSTSPQPHKTGWRESPPGSGNYVWAE